MPNSTQLSNEEKEKTYTDALNQLKKYENAFPQIVRQLSDKEDNIRVKAKFYKDCSDVEEHLHSIIQQVEELKKQGEPIEDLTIVLEKTYLRLTNQLDAEAYDAIAKKMQKKSSIGMKALGAALILLGVAIMTVILLPMVPPLFGFATIPSALFITGGGLLFFPNNSLSNEMRGMSNNLVAENKHRI